MLATPSPAFSPTCSRHAQPRVSQAHRPTGSTLEARTRAWVEQRYGRPLAELDAGSLLACVDALSRGLHRRNGALAA